MKLIQCDACGIEAQDSPQNLDVMARLEYGNAKEIPFMAFDLCPNCFAEVGETIAKIQTRERDKT